MLVGLFFLIRQLVVHDLIEITQIVVIDSNLFLLL